MSNSFFPTSNSFFLSPIPFPQFAGVCGEAASAELTSTDLSLCISEVQQAINCLDDQVFMSMCSSPPELSVEAALRLKEVLLGIEEKLGEQY